MKVETLIAFNDLKENKTRKKGDIFTVSQNRFKEINSTKYGVLVEKKKEMIK